MQPGGGSTIGFLVAIVGRIILSLHETVRPVPLRGYVQIIGNTPQRSMNEAKPPLESVSPHFEDDRTTRQRVDEQSMAHETGTSPMSPQFQ